MRSERLRVLYSFPHVVGRPGIGYTALNQIEGLVKAGVDVTVVASAVTPDCTLELPVNETFRLAGIRLPRRIFGSQRAMAMHDTMAARLLERMHNQVDLVHCWPSGALKTLQAARRLGVRSVLERPSSHTAFVKRVVEEELSKLPNSADRKHYSRVTAERLDRELSEFDAADFLLCPSEWVRTTFLREGFPREQLRLHQYGYDPRRFFPGAAGEREPLRFLYCGEGIVLKGLHVLLRAWHQSLASSCAKLDIVGVIDPEFQEAFKSMLDHESVHCHGFIGDVAPMMRKAQALILPSFAEGSALVIFEARACGCVAVVSDASGARFDLARSALVHRAGDDQELARHLRLFVDQPGDVSTVRSASGSDIPAWTWERAGQVLADVYRNVI